MKKSIFKLFTTLTLVLMMLINFIPKIFLRLIMF